MNFDLTSERVIASDDGETEQKSQELSLLVTNRAVTTLPSLSVASSPYDLTVLP